MLSRTYAQMYSPAAFWWSCHSGFVWLNDFSLRNAVLRGTAASMDLDSTIPDGIEIRSSHGGMPCTQVVRSPSIGPRANEFNIPGRKLMLSDVFELGLDSRNMSA